MLTKSQIEEYLSAPTLTCLLCGKTGFRSLTRHLRTKHNVSARQYKLDHNIPLTKALTCQDSLTKFRKISATQGRSTEQHKALALKMLEARKSNPPKITSTKHEAYLKFDFSKVFDLIKQNRTLKQALEETPGAPSYETFNRMTKLMPSLSKEYKDAVHSLPYNLQAKHQMLSEQFIVDCIDMKTKLGYTIKRIATITGVSTQTVTKAIRSGYANTK